MPATSSAPQLRSYAPTPETAVELRSVPTGVRRSSHYFPEIESLRGIAIVLVVLHHANAWVRAGGDTPGTVVSPWWAFIAGGQTGVSLFFVLSGFLLSMPFLREARGGQRVRRANYFRRRAYRILPIYYTAVLVGTVLSANGWADLTRGIPYLFFLNNGPLVTPMQPYSSVWWSLATEAQFYLVLPLLPLCLTTRVGRWAGIVLLAAYFIALGLLVNGRLSPNLPWTIALTHSLLGRGYMFVFGIVAAAIYVRYAGRLQTSWSRLHMVQNGGADVALIVALIALAILLRWQVFVGYWNMECIGLHCWHLAEASLWTTILLIAVMAPFRMKPLFCNRVLGRLGVLSYSIYILHLPLIHFAFLGLRRQWPDAFVGWTAATVAAVAATTLLCVALSEVTYRVIEQPFLQRKARIATV